MEHPATATTPAPAGVDTPMSHREVLEALSGLLLGMFVAILASTVVSNALPRIIGDLDGGQTAYTWVVTATLLATTVDHADLGQARRPVQPQAAGPARARRSSWSARRWPGFARTPGCSSASARCRASAPAA